MMLPDIKRLVATFYGVTRAEMETRKGARHISWPRQSAMALCREFSRHSYTQIGRAFGRDHTTVMHAENALAHRVWSDPVHFTEFLSLLAQVEAGEITEPSGWAAAGRATRFRRLMDNPFRDQESLRQESAAFVQALHSSNSAARPPSGTAVLSGPRALSLRGPGAFSGGV